MQAERSGEIIAGRYLIDAEIGRGGVGIVYRATDQQTGEPVALKILAEQMAKDPIAVRRFEREARVASNLAHPNAVRVTDFGHDEANVYLAMTLLEGQNLRQVFSERGCPSLRDTLCLMTQLCSVLVAAHELGLVHRDLKPENIFIDWSQGQPRPIVVDFGLAILVGDETGRLTITGEVLGSPGYMSPEQASAVMVGPPSDIYSLGCVFYEALSGTPPFPGTGAEVISSHLYDTPPPLSPRVQSLNLRVDNLVLSMLSKGPGWRPTAAQVLDELRAMEAGQPTSADIADRLCVEPQAIDPTRCVAVVGPLDTVVRHALNANGFHVVDPADATDEGFVLITEGGVDEVAKWVGGGHLVVGCVASADTAVLSAWLRAGAAEVTVLPLASDELLASLERMYKKRARRRS